MQYAIIVSYYVSAYSITKIIKIKRLTKLINKILHISLCQVLTQAEHPFQQLESTFALAQELADLRRILIAGSPSFMQCGAQRASLSGLCLLAQASTATRSSPKH